MKPFIGPKGVANLSTEEAGSIIAYLRNLNGEAPAVAAAPKTTGDPEAGEAAFNINCMACHQPGGEGKPGFAPSIRNQDFLAIASDDFIKETVSKGRPGTAMIGRPDLSDTVLNDIIAYLRALPTKTYKPVEVDPTKTFHGDAGLGKDKFATYCASCHGQNGEGYVAGVPGPGIGLEGFLSIASDDYIFQTVKRGRVGTAMKPLIGAEGVANLSEEDVHDIIAHLRNKNN
jgi:mono/diheme cytochrome c family protein